MKKSAYKSTSSLRARRRQRRVRVAVVWSVFVLLILAGAAALSWLPALRIDSIEVSGTESISAASVQASVEKIISGTYLFVVPKNNILLYPKRSIRNAVRGQFSAIMSVEVHARNFHTIRVDVVERGPTALWCGETSASSSPCFLLDQNGLAYSSAADFSGDAYVRYFGTLSGEQLPKQYISAQQFRALSALVDELAKKSGTIVRVSVDQHSDVRVSFANGFDLLFLLSDDGGSILSRYALALTSAPFLSRTISDFSYLDLRFGDKLYYKLKGQ